MLEANSKRTKILKICWRIISSPFRVLWWILFKKEIREIKWYEKIPRNIISAYLYLLAIFFILEGLGGCIVYHPSLPKEHCAFELFLGISTVDIQMIPREICGFVHICIGLIAFIIAHRISVRKVCMNCHLNRGVKHVRKELVHEGYWVPVQKDGRICYTQENIYKHHYECKECGWGYTTERTTTRQK